MVHETDKHEFRVTLSGLDLAPDHIERINNAVKTAVMTELASLDLPHGIGIEFPRPPILGIIILPPGELNAEERDS